MKFHKRNAREVCQNFSGVFLSFLENVRLLIEFLKNRFRAFKFCSNGFVERFKKNCVFKKALLILMFFPYFSNQLNQQKRSLQPTRWLREKCKDKLLTFGANLCNFLYLLMYFWRFFCRSFQSKKDPILQADRACIMLHSANNSPIAAAVAVILQKYIVVFFVKGN